MVPNCTLAIVIRRASDELWRFIGLAYLHHLTIGVSGDEQEGISHGDHFRDYWKKIAEDGEEVWLC